MQKSQSIKMCFRSLLEKKLTEYKSFENKDAFSINSNTLQAT